MKSPPSALLQRLWASWALGTIRRFRYKRDLRPDTLVLRRIQMIQFSICSSCSAFEPGIYADGTACAYDAWMAGQARRQPSASGGMLSSCWTSPGGAGNSSL